LLTCVLKVNGACQQWSPFVAVTGDRMSGGAVTGWSVVRPTLTCPLGYEMVMRSNNTFACAQTKDMDQHPGVPE